MDDKNRFSILLEHLLEVAEVKNYTLAKHLQYDVSYISKWVSGRMLPAKKTEKRVMEGISACVVDEATDDGRDLLLREYSVSIPSDLKAAIYDNLIAEYDYLQEELDSSEAGSNATLPMAPFPVRDGNVGVPMIHSVISIFKPGTQEELTYNTPGEICITGPGVMLGYDRPEATAKALQVHADGKTWLHTGDIGYMSEDGVLYTMTRGASPRFGGGDLMVQPLENIVADADIKGIKDEFFVIVPDDEHEGCFLPYLYVQLKDGYTLDDVRDKINACLPERYMRPVEIFTVPERPFFHFKTNRIGLCKEIVAKRNQQKEKAKRNSFADACIA